MSLTALSAKEFPALPALRMVDLITLHGFLSRLCHAWESWDGTGVQITVDYGSPSNPLNDWLPNTKPVPWEKIQKMSQDW